MQSLVAASLSKPYDVDGRRKDPLDEDNTKLDQHRQLERKFLCLYGTLITTSHGAAEAIIFRYNDSR